MSELRLPVGPQVLVAESTGKLVIPFDACYHQHLLVLLWGLGQSIELARALTAGNKKLSSSFGSALEKHGRLDFQKVVGVKVLPDRHAGSMTKLERI